MHVLFVSPDLLFASRVQATTEQVGKVFRAAGANTLDQLAPAPECRLIFLDLATLGVVNSAIINPLRTACPNAKIIAFGPHVDDVTLAAAREAGCDEVQTRGQFHREYAVLIANTFAVA